MDSPHRPPCPCPLSDLLDKQDPLAAPVSTRRKPTRVSHSGRRFFTAQWSPRKPGSPFRMGRVSDLEALSGCPGIDRRSLYHLLPDRGDSGSLGLDGRKRGMEKVAGA